MVTLDSPGLKCDCLKMDKMARVVSAPLSNPDDACVTSLQ
jgi:hypothetical protein